MHLGNGIICPVTGIPMIAVAVGTAFYAYKKAKKDFDKDKIMPVVTLTMLVFAMQMINFAIPSTGSSGHIIGATLLSALIGPYAAFLAICAILLVQAVFFADGGLLAIGCNIFNMGFLACFIAYPLLYKPLANKNKPVTGAILASVAALQLGSIAVVAEAALSGSITGNLFNFMGMMQLIHLPIGIIEGIATGGIVLLSKFVNSKNLSYIFGGTSLVLAGIISQYASTKPDGLEWSLLNISDPVVIQSQYALYNLSEAVQAKTAVFASMPSAFGSIAGLLSTGALMYLASMIISKKTVKVNAE